MKTNSAMNHPSKKTLGAIALLLLVFSTSAVFATTQTITSLYNTGQDNAHNALPVTSVDPHYILQTNPYDGSSNAFAVNTFYAWVAPTTSDTNWITPCLSGNDACDNDHETVHTGHYIYALTFTLDAGYHDAHISGLWGADNNAMMYINGQLVTAGGTTPARGFDDLTAFSVSGDASLFNFGGLNTLTFDVFQAPSSVDYHDPTGLLVQIRGTETTPEPSSLLLLGSGSAGLAGLLRRKLLR